MGGARAQAVRSAGRCPGTALHGSPLVRLSCCPTRRRALAVLPQLVLHFPDDPPGMQHPVSCLLEAVRTQQSSPSPAAAAPQTPAAAAAAPPWSVRVTVFSAAGAVACWHEGEMGCSAVMLASPATGAPMWWTGPSLRSFSLEFPLASGLQLELFKGGLRRCLQAALRGAGSAGLRGSLLASAC